MSDPKVGSIIFGSAATKAMAESWPHGEAVLSPSYPATQDAQYPSAASHPSLKPAKPFAPKPMLPDVGYINTSRLEPNVLETMPAGAIVTVHDLAEMSIAISLKRIADAMERNQVDITGPSFDPISDILAKAEAGQ